LTSWKQVNLSPRWLDPAIASDKIDHKSNAQNRGIDGMIWTGCQSV